MPVCRIVTVRNLRAIRWLYRDYKVQEATKDLIFTVTQYAVDNSKRKDPSHCAVAEGMKFSIPGNFEACAWASTVYIINHDTQIITRYLTTAAIGRYIKEFDETGKFIPGEYRLIAPYKGQRLDAKKPGRVTDGTGKSQRRKSPIKLRECTLMRTGGPGPAR